MAHKKGKKSRMLFFLCCLFCNLFLLICLWFFFLLPCFLFVVGVVCLVLRGVWRDFLMRGGKHTGKGKTNLLFFDLIQPLCLSLHSVHLLQCHLFPHLCWRSPINKEHWVYHQSSAAFSFSSLTSLTVEFSCEETWHIKRGNKSYDVHHSGMVLFSALRSLPFLLRSLPCRLSLFQVDSRSGF